MKRFLSLIYGLVAYLFFLVTFIYTVLFLCNIVVPKTIDRGPQSPALAAVAINVIFLTLFAAQHSIMARKGFKRMWTKIIPKELERPTYVLAATLALILLLWAWRPLPQTVWEISGVPATVLTITFWLGWVLLLSSSFLINHFELFGVQQVWGYFRRKQYSAVRFRTPLLYRLVRHPLYLGFIISFWSAPHMSVGHLMFASMTTLYILMGIHLEERDLVAEHGEVYRRYQAEVPMLLPVGNLQSKPVPERDPA